MNQQTGSTQSLANGGKSPASSKRLVALAVAAWLVGLIVLQIARTAQIAAASSYPLQLSPQLLIPRLDLHTQAILLWTVLVLLLAARSTIRSATKSSPSSKRADYLLVWTAGIIVLVTLGTSMLDTLAPDVFGQSPPLSEVRYEDGAISNASSPSLSSAPDSGASTSEVLTLIAIWTTIVVVAFFIIGDGAEEGFHKNYVFPYRSVLTTFTLVILLIVLANIMAHSATNLRVQSLNAPAALISRTSTNLAQAASSVSESGTNLGLLLETSKVPPDFMADNQQAVLVWRSKQFDQIRKLGNDLAQDAGSMSAYAVAAGNQMDSALALVEGDAARMTAQEELEAVHAVLQ
jgi:hypothetical protein